MAIILDDNFNSDSIGSSPAGWTGIGSGGTVVGFGAPPPHTGANNCVGLKNSIQQAFIAQSQGILSFSYATTELPPLSTIVNLKSSGVGGTFNLITLIIEHDLSISAVTLTGPLTDVHTSLPANSNIVSGFYTYPNKFDFFQVLFNVAENGNHSIQVSVTLIMNGFQVFDATANSGVFTTTQCPANLQTVEFVNDTVGFPGAFLDNVVIDNDPLSGYPYPGNPTTFQALLTQLPVERIDLPNNAPIRLSQEAFEMLNLPSDQRIRLSQLVIEVIHGKAAVPAGGWHVKEM